MATPNCRPVSALSALLKVAVIIAATFQMTGAGCAAYMVGGMVLDANYKATAPEYVRKRSFEEAVRSTRTKIEQEFGPPVARLREADTAVTYSLYQLVQSHSAGCAAPGVCWGAGTDTHCYLLSFDGDNVLLEATMRRGDGTCLGVFWPEDQETQMQDAVLYWYEKRVAEKSPAAWGLLCSEANKGYVSAQIELAQLHSTSKWHGRSADEKAWLSQAGIQPDDRIAYMWHALARSRGHAEGAHAIEALESRLDQRQLAEARGLVNTWMSGDCPAPKQALATG
jgi:TPR repeat protein